MESIDYEKAEKLFRKHKSALTRAKNTHEPLLIIAAANAALEAFEEFGSYPDNWRLWERAGEDALHEYRLRERW